ncbi:MAG: response regulator [Bacteroidetes bacterium]|nr:response regulator [Bacteroidota bacterium]
MKEKIILLVEDNPDDVELTLRALKKNNIKNKVVIKTDGAEAVDYLFGESNNPGITQPSLPAVVLLDLKLPKVDGFEVLRMIRTKDRTKHLPVVILTSSKEEHDIVRCYDMGANSYIRKPVDFQKFIEAIKYLGLYWLTFNETAPNKFI